MHRSLRHMAWANQRVYTAFSALPDDALDAFIVNPDWTARRILQHIVSGSDWYVFCLGIAAWNDIPTPRTIADIQALASILEKCDSHILSAADLDDEELTFVEGENETKVRRSTLLAEAAMHATEHRAQLMDAIESKGLSSISLDSIDLWAFESYEKNTIFPS